MALVGPTPRVSRRPHSGHHLGRAHASGSRAVGDAGATMVEAALLTPLFLLVVFGLLEFGGAFRDSLTVNNASQVGARAAGIAGRDADADWKIVQAVLDAAAAMPRGSIKRIVVYKATDGTTGVPSACTTSATGIATGPNPCNVYLPADFGVTDPTAWSNCASSSNPSRFWCPSTRKTAATAAQGNGPPDFAGVWVQAQHLYITGFFGRSVVLTSTTVAQLESRSVS